jgi:hypothetical protein
MITRSMTRELIKNKTKKRKTRKRKTHKKSKEVIKPRHISPYNTRWSEKMKKEERRKEIEAFEKKKRKEEELTKKVNEETKKFFFLSSMKDGLFGKISAREKRASDRNQRKLLRNFKETKMEILKNKVFKTLHWTLSIAHNFYTQNEGVFEIYPPDNFLNNLNVMESLATDRKDKIKIIFIDKIDFIQYCIIDENKFQNEIKGNISKKRFRVIMDRMQTINDNDLKVSLLKKSKFVPL